MSSTWTLALAGTFSWGLGTLVQLVFIIAVAVVVRRQRPDAAPLLLGALLFELLVSFASFAANLLLPRAAGYATFVEAQAISTAVFAVAHAATRALLIWGVLRLAQPAPG